MPGQPKQRVTSKMQLMQNPEKMASEVSGRLKCPGTFDLGGHSRVKEDDLLEVDLEENLEEDLEMSLVENVGGSIVTVNPEILIVLGGSLVRSFWWRLSGWTAF